MSRKFLPCFPIFMPFFNNPAKQRWIPKASADYIFSSVPMESDEAV
ncbi:hypothetical protein CLOSYM_00985 [[Clostridium] symbiosum ATCC 14940]|uniref:Uncharacterized protein n=1 Tax=[Clostridium] symbiosum ATCC 14940 TaxID=411472 RepID=A0ABC9U1K2_CLOSY|nr:hypothetical protein CLOSYM_00985 [[Clostridium] symbiosum ATCC 14940]